MCGTPVGEWYVLFCKPRREQQVCALLHTQGFETFYPTLPVRTSPLRAPQQQPLFPRYLFVRADLAATGTAALEWIPGAVGLVKYGDVPAQIPAPVIEHWRARLGELRARGDQPLRDLRPGEVVRIVRGPFSGYDAVFDTRLSSSERVRVLLRMLGRQVQVDLHVNAIEARPGLR